MIRLSKPQILLLHEQLITETGGSCGLRDEGMLDSALSAPFQTFGGEDVYPSLQQKGACLCFGLVKNHPFNPHFSVQSHQSSLKSCTSSCGSASFEAVSLVSNCEKRLSR